MRPVRVRFRAAVLLCVFCSTLLVFAYQMHINYGGGKPTGADYGGGSDDGGGDRKNVDTFRGVRVPDVKADRRPLPVEIARVNDGFPDKPLLNMPPMANAPLLEDQQRQLLKVLPQGKVENIHEGYNSGGLFEPKTAKGAYPVLKNGNFIPSNRIFHLDLKGAAPRVQYYTELFSFISKIGATGILIEWEDMFPFEGVLEGARASNAYSKEDVRAILSAAEANNLNIIPLVQTFGHLEWILKYEKFAKYRQVDRYPQVICLADEDAVNLVKTALDQVLAAHREFNMPFFHIGADEAFQVGMCQKDVDFMQQHLEGSREKLMLRHIAEIAKHVLLRAPKTRVLMWHDMLNNVDTSIMKQYKLGNLVEPVVWNYAESLDDQLYPEMWERLGSIFPYIWGASAYKGADGPNRYYSNVNHYLANHRSWTNQMNTAYKSFKQFRGLIFTGWQRFDHFAVLCELLPVGLMSAAINYAMIQQGSFDRSVLRSVSTLMECSSTIDLDSPDVQGYCKFPGAAIYQDVQHLKTALDQIEENVHKDYQVHGWLSTYNIRHNYSQPWYLDQILDKLNMHISDLEGLAVSLRKDMEPVFFPDTIDEFIFEYLEPEFKRLHDLREAAMLLPTHRTFRRRPFRVRNAFVQKGSRLLKADSKETKKSLFGGSNNNVEIRR